MSISVLEKLKNHTIHALFYRESVNARSVTNSPYLFTFLLFTPIVKFPN